MIERITLRIGEKTIDLTIEEAASLKADLDRILPNPVSIPTFWPLIPGDSPASPQPWMPYWSPSTGDGFEITSTTTGEAV
jgi:hypothetical protein